jgi:hypothetical protein
MHISTRIVILDAAKDLATLYTKRHETTQINQVSVPRVAGDPACRKGLENHIS